VGEGAGGRARRERGLGRLAKLGQKWGRRPVKPRNAFSFSFSNSRISKPFQIQILRRKRHFQDVTPK
jgi:hypothetical protein